MLKNPEIKYNIDPILKQINNIIVNGVDNIVCEFIDNYKMYEETHKTIMGLPVIQNLLNGKKNMNYVSLVDSDDEIDSSMSKTMKEYTSELVENVFNRKFKEKDQMIKELLLEVTELKFEISKLKVMTSFTKIDIDEESSIQIKSEKEEPENIKLVIEPKEVYESNQPYIHQMNSFGENSEEEEK